MSHAYVIEAAGQTAGIAVKIERGYRFFSSDPQFHVLDGRDFSSVATAERTVAHIVSGKARQAGKT
jgi:hypothetical protein